MGKELLHQGHQGTLRQSCPGFLHLIWTSTGVGAPTAAILLSSPGVAHAFRRNSCKQDHETALLKTSYCFYLLGLSEFNMNNTVICVRITHQQADCQKARVRPGVLRDPVETRQRRVRRGSCWPFLLLDSSAQYLVRMMSRLTMLEHCSAVTNCRPEEKGLLKK